MATIKDEAPRYKLAQDGYIDDRLYSSGMEYTDLQGKHIPGPHWEPLNEAAKAKAAECKIEYTGEVPDTVGELTKRLAEAQAREAGKGDPDQIAAAIVKALAAQDRIKPPAAKGAKASSDEV